MVSWRERRPVREVLNADSDVTGRLEPEQLDELFDYAYYTRYVDDSFRRLGLLP